MSVNPAIWDAVSPTGAPTPVNKTLLRNAITARTAYVLADDEDASELVCVDPETGAAVSDLIFKGFIFHFDAADSSSAADDVTILVSNEGRRYKIANSSDVIAYSVLQNDLTSPPDAPDLGDAYLVAAGATGDWAAHDGDVAIFTARGWLFVSFAVGRAIYIENIDAYYHRKTDGTWASGLGNLTVGTSTVALSAVINFGQRVICENQTTNASPASPAVGDAYIIGSSPTGTWAGKSGKIAICELTGQFTIYTPMKGWAAYDKSLSNEYIWDGTQWSSAGGAWIGLQSIFTPGGVASFGGSGAFNYSVSAAPTTSQRRYAEGSVLTRAARVGIARLRVNWSGDVVVSTNTGSPPTVDSTGAIALFRDTETNAIAWYLYSNQGQNHHINATFMVDVNDTNSHTYGVALMSGGAANANWIDYAPNRRTFTIEERA